jgi:hypothetical protein
MGRFDKPSDPRSPARPRQSGDNVPLLPLRRGSRNQNIWNNDGDEEDFTPETRRKLLERKSEDTFHEFLDEENEDTEGLLGANGHGEGAAMEMEPLKPSTDSEIDEDEAKLLADDSAYEEVRAAVSNTDDSSMACVRSHTS